MGYSETHGIPRKEHFFPRNNENRSESIPRISSERNFDGNPTVAPSEVAKKNPSYGRPSECLMPLFVSWQRLLSVQTRGEDPGDFLAGVLHLRAAGLREAEAEPGRRVQEAVQHPPQERGGHLQAACPLSPHILNTVFLHDCSPMIKQLF